MGWRLWVLPWVLGAACSPVSGFGPAEAGVVHVCPDDAQARAVVALWSAPHCRNPGQIELSTIDGVCRRLSSEECGAPVVIPDPRRDFLTFSLGGRQARGALTYCYGEQVDWDGGWIRYEGLTSWSEGDDGRIWDVSFDLGDVGVAETERGSRHPRLSAEDLRVVRCR